MNIENMTIFDWFKLKGHGIVGGIISFLVTSYIKWLGEEADK